MVAGRQDLIPVDYIDTLKKIPGIQSVEPRLWGYYHDSYSGANYTIMVNAALNDDTGNVIIGTGVSRRGATEKAGQRLHKNDVIPLKASDGSVLALKVKGLLSASSELVTADLIQTSEEDFRKLFSFDHDKATDLVLRVRNSKELETIAAKIIQLYPDTRPILRDQILRTYDAIFDWRGGIIIVILSGAVFAFIILAWDKATGLSAEEKREIGILKAVGWETSDILMMKFWEGATISLTSFFIGILLAYLHVFIFSVILFEPVLKGWSTLYPDIKLTPYINGYQVTTLFFLTVLPYTVVTIIPSWRSATIDPDSVMRA